MPAIHDKQNLRNILLQHSPVRVGRSQDNDLVIMGREVSRYHCELRRDFLGRWLLKQLGSSKADQETQNLTFVRRSGKVMRLKPGGRSLKLQAGDEIALGLKRDQASPTFRLTYVTA